MVRLRTEQRDEAVQQIAQIEVRVLQIEFARFDLREIEDVVDDVHQRVRRGADDPQVFLHFRLERMIERQLRHADDAVHRRPDLVAHVREELRLEPRRLEAPLHALRPARARRVRSATSCCSSRVRRVDHLDQPPLLRARRASRKRIAPHTRKRGGDTENPTNQRVWSNRGFNSIAGVTPAAPHRRLVRRFDAEDMLAGRHARVVRGAPRAGIDPVRIEAIEPVAEPQPHRRHELRTRCVGIRGCPRRGPR